MGAKVSVLAGMAILCLAQASNFKSLLVAYPNLFLYQSSGDGKTCFCNRYEGNCGIEGAQDGEYAGFSTTFVAHEGQYFFDSPGFGEHFKDVDRQAEAGSFSNSLNAIYRTFLAVKGKQLNSIIWIVPCTSFVSKHEEYEFMNFFSDMLGRSIPIVAVFNPLHPTNQCVRKPETFLAAAETKGLNVREVIDFNKFDPTAYFKKYSKSFEIILPDNLEEIFKARDPKTIAAELKKQRELQCKSLPDHLVNIRARMDAHRGNIKAEEVAPCVKAICTIPQPGMNSCTHRECVAQDATCVSVAGVVENCSTYCSRYDMVTDEACTKSNEARMTLFQSTLRTCEENAEHSHAVCLESMPRRLKAIKDENARIQKDIVALKAEEESTSAKLATCNL